MDNEYNHIVVPFHAPQKSMLSFSKSGPLYHPMSWKMDDGLLNLL